MRIQFHIRVLNAGRFVSDVLLSVAALCIVTLIPLLPFVDFVNVVKLQQVWAHVAIYAAAAIVSVRVCRTYRMIWRYVSFADFITLVKSATLTIAIFSALEFAAFSQQLMKTSVVLMAYAASLVWVANVCVLAAPRFFARSLNGPRPRKLKGQQFNSIPILVTGNLQRVEAFLRACRNDPNSHYRVVGVLADDPVLHGSYLDGLEVLGSLKDLKSVLALLQQKLAASDMPSTLVFAKDDASRKDFEYVLREAASTGLKIGRLPPHDALHGRKHFSVEPIALADLLGRKELVADAANSGAFIGGSRILVTGAGGSIGSELTRQIAALKPEKLIILDSSEFNLYSIDKELSERFPGLSIDTRLVDVRDGALVERCIRDTRPHVVLHAAALKHVPLVEANAIEGIKTNVCGTINVAEACCAHGVRAMVTISTDKAVHPTNVMGATKRLAEAYCQGLDQSLPNGSGTRFITVRFGNVLGSAGSVVPLFQRQIEAGGPITVTHPDITRYFMTIPEAVSLVLQAGAQGVNMDDERGSIYVLDMGEPVKISDLARQMIILSGKTPDTDIEIKYVGLRPGEKLYEELSYQDEHMQQTRSKSIMRLKPRATDLRILRQQVQELKGACEGSDAERSRRILKLAVPEFVSGASSGKEPRTEEGARGL